MPDVPRPVDDDTAGLPGWGPRVAVVLAAVAGYVDAVSFSQLFGVFPANQSGNVILAGIAIGNGDWGQLWRPVLAIVAFGLGVAVAVALTDRWDPQPRRRVLVLVELVLLIAYTIPAVRVVTSHPMVGGPGAAALLLVGAVAMGVQTDAVRRVAGRQVATTYQTGAITRLAETAIRAVRGTTPSSDRAGVTVALLTVVLLGYLGGAAIGQFVGRHWRGALIVPCVVLGLLLVLDLARARRGSDSTRADAD